MALVPNMTTYDLKGKKLSFANWISNISPTDTLFVSMTGKEAISQTVFQWQTDRLPAVDKNNAQVEGSKPTDASVIKTEIKTNTTQILRKVVQVSDTANAVAAFGRGRELQYQMEKAGAEIKRDLELAFLTQGAKVDGSATNTARKTAGFQGLVAALDAVDTDTGAKVHIKSGVDNKLTEEKLFELTYNMYMANSKANTIMFHPQHALFFSELVETAAADGASRLKVFENMDEDFNMYVDTLIDPLGQKFALIPNRFMPTDMVYIFNPVDWTQMVFRAPERVKLAKEGSYEQWMIEMEVGLRHRNPYASGILELKA